MKLLFNDGDEHIGSDGATQICVFTAFFLAPTNFLMRKCCLIHLKNNSTCQRLLGRRGKAHRVKLGGVRLQADLNIAQAFAPSQLYKSHGTKLLGTRQRSYARVAPVAIRDADKARPRHELHNPCKQGLANLHGDSPEKSIRGKYSVLSNTISSRHQTKSGRMPRHRLICRSASII